MALVKSRGGEKPGRLRPYRSPLLAASKMKHGAYPPESQPGMHVKTPEPAGSSCVRAPGPARWGQPCGILVAVHSLRSEASE